MNAVQEAGSGMKTPSMDDDDSNMLGFVLSGWLDTLQAGSQGHGVTFEAGRRCLGFFFFPLFAPPLSSISFLSY